MHLRVFMLLPLLRERPPQTIIFRRQLALQLVRGLCRGATLARLQAGRRAVCAVWLRAVQQRMAGGLR